MDREYFEYLGKFHSDCFHRLGIAMPVAKMLFQEIQRTRIGCVVGIGLSTLASD